MQVGQKPFTQRKPDQLVYLELGAGNGGMLLSISDDGFRFRAVSPVRADGPMPFAFSLDGTQRLEGRGEIEWLEDDGKSGGLRFTEVSGDFRLALDAWLASNSSHLGSYREAVPAASTPLDTMEKIRQELRSGYPNSPGRQSNQSVSIPPFSGVAKESPADRKDQPAEPRSTAKGLSTAKRLFPLAEAPEPAKSEPVKSITSSSAFLKTPRATLPAPLALQVVDSAPSSLLASAPVASKVSLPTEPRPYIPPLEDSFENAWARAKLTSPPESPRLSRAAAGGVIAIALAVILGALAFNFRQDIGTLFIELGQKISGDNRVTDTAPPAETKSPALPADPSIAARKTPEPATSPSGVSGQAGTATVPGSTSPSGGTPSLSAKTGAVPSAANGAANADAAQTSGPDASPAKPQQTLPEQPAVDSGTGQEEFGVARELLHSGSRQRDLPRAVDLLWTSVKRGYVPAEVTLADLYLRGDGVEKNCDQARILLVAASKKGSTEARQLLEQVAERGCE
jgi:hypothetical protein